MTYDEATVLIGFINGIDKRVVFEETTISAWANVLGPNIGLDDAMRYVREHYQSEDRAVLPAHIVGRHRIALRSLEPAPKLERSHDCQDGWVMVVEERNGREYSAASRCPQCQPNSVRLKS